MDLFESALTIAAEDIEVELRARCLVPWAEFILNPRRLRGSDFLMRWSQGVWSEHRLIEAVGETDRYFALSYGPSSTAPTDDIRAHELYFDRLEHAGLGRIKRPDLLVFRKSDRAAVDRAVANVGGPAELPFTGEENVDMSDLLCRAILAVECENSLWQARRMPDYGAELRPMRRLGGKLGLRKNAVLPTVWIKEEDRVPLRDWQELRDIRIHVWQVFYDMGFGLSLDTAQELIDAGKIEPRQQVYHAPGGATTTKITYRFYYHYGYHLGDTRDEPTLVADYITDKNGHILPYVKFEGGSFRFSDDALEVLDKASRERGR